MQKLTRTTTTTSILSTLNNHAQVSKAKLNTEFEKNRYKKGVKPNFI